MKERAQRKALRKANAKGGEPAERAAIGVLWSLGVYWSLGGLQVCIHTHVHSFMYMLH
jgi:hypothetical protein